MFATELLGTDTEPRSLVFLNLPGGVGYIKTLQRQWQQAVYDLERVRVRLANEEGLQIVGDVADAASDTAVAAEPNLTSTEAVLPSQGEGGDQ